MLMYQGAQGSYTHAQRCAHSTLPVWLSSRPAKLSSASRQHQHQPGLANSYSSVQRARSAAFAQSVPERPDGAATEGPPAPVASEQHTKAWKVLASRVGRAICLGLTVLAIQQLFIPAAPAAASAATSGSNNALSGLISFILHLDKHLSAMIEQHGRTTYAILWAIVFAETGLVLTPFLPGDSLLFAAGAFAGMGKLDVGILMLVFLSSAILGDAVNYAVGQRLGGWALDKNIVKREYIDKTEEFYAKYGGKTVVLARFVPIIRTFAPFVAGVGSMPYARFATYNVVGAIIWSVLFVGAGFIFGNLPLVQKNFTLVVFAIVAVSVVPVIMEIINARRGGEKSISS